MQRKVRRFGENVGEKRKSTKRRHVGWRNSW